MAKLPQRLQRCETPKQRIAGSRRLAGQLLQTALREAPTGPGGAEPQPERPQRPGPAGGMTGNLFAGVK